MMKNISELSDKARLECGWMLTFSWNDLERYLNITTISMENWTRALIKHDFNVIMACPLATNYKYTFGELSSSGRSDWAQYAKVLEQICKE